MPGGQDGRFQTTIAPDQPAPTLGGLDQHRGREAQAGQLHPPPRRQDARLLHGRPRHPGPPALPGLPGLPPPRCQDGREGQQRPQMFPTQRVRQEPLPSLRLSLSRVRHPDLLQLEFVHPDGLPLHGDVAAILNPPNGLSQRRTHCEFEGGQGLLPSVRQVLPRHRPAGGGIRGHFAEPAGGVSHRRFPHGLWAHPNMAGGSGAEVRIQLRKAPAIHRNSPERLPKGQQLQQRG